VTALSPAHPRDVRARAHAVSVDALSALRVTARAGRWRRCWAGKERSAVPDVGAARAKHLSPAGASPRAGQVVQNLRARVAVVWWCRGTGSRPCIAAAIAAAGARAAARARASGCAAATATARACTGPPRGVVASVDCSAATSAPAGADLSTGATASRGAALASCSGSARASISAGAAGAKRASADRSRCAAVTSGTLDHARVALEPLVANLRGGRASNHEHPGEQHAHASMIRPVSRFEKCYQESCSNTRTYASARDNPLSSVA
jgi:hypothetical protein